MEEDEEEDEDEEQDIENYSSSDRQETFGSPPQSYQVLRYHYPQVCSHSDFE